MQQDRPCCSPPALPALARELPVITAPSPSSDASTKSVYLVPTRMIPVGGADGGTVIGFAPAAVDPDAAYGEILAAPAVGPTIVSIAMSYLGYPYVAAGAGPGRFDCSGFTRYVVGLATASRSPRGVAALFGGILRRRLRPITPGDIIFFPRTRIYAASHAAIYIGDGMIIHAENYESGVTIIAQHLLLLLRSSLLGRRPDR
ncbi:MAG: C40 family peptidase [Thermomicrobiales bacterium]